MKPHGNEYIYVICSVCQGKFHRKDTIKVHDRYNQQNGRIVCKWDIDETNPQSYPIKIIERAPDDLELLTGKANVEFATPLVDDRLPSAPLNPFAVAAVFTDGIELYWQAPLNQGSSDIQGYLIERADPQLGGYDVITSNSNNPDAYYNDVTAIQSTFYSYRIKAINTFGASPYSIEFFYPYQNVRWADINYLLMSQNGSVITTGAGVAIRLNHLDAGVI